MGGDETRPSTVAQEQQQIKKGCQSDSHSPGEAEDGRPVRKKSWPSALRPLLVSSLALFKVGQ